MKIINATAHELTLYFEGGACHDVPPDGVVLRAASVERVVLNYDGLQLVNLSFTPTEASEVALRQLESEYPGALIIGSLIAAQAWPGRVVAGLPVRLGYRGINAHKFQVFEKVVE